MSSSHIFYIPLALLIGLVAGTFLGRRSVVVQREEEDRVRRRREMRERDATQEDAARRDAGREVQP